MATANAKVQAKAKAKAQAKVQAKAKAKAQAKANVKSQAKAKVKAKAKAQVPPKGPDPKDKNQANQDAKASRGGGQRVDRYCSWRHHPWQVGCHGSDRPLEVLGEEGQPRTIGPLQDLEGPGED
jgi:colicin import membrane protein